MGLTTIEWTDASWNPVRGCSRVSEGCRHCYAEGIAARFSKEGQAYEGLAVMTTSGPRWTGEVRLIEERLEDPIRWKKPLRIFVNSMSDLFHEKLPDADIDRVFEVMGACDDAGIGHTFQVLTKRPERMLRYMKTRARAAWNSYRMNRSVFPPRNIWLGVSVEDQATADERIPLLLQTPADCRFISAEPLLGPVDVSPYLRRLPTRGPGWKLTGGLALEIADVILDLVIAGGESGHHARPSHPDWFRGLRDQCVKWIVPFFFKQQGEWLPVIQSDGDIHYVATALDTPPSRPKRAAFHDFDDGQRMIRVGKRAAGRLLDGVEWNQMPESMYEQE